MGTYYQTPAVVVPEDQDDNVLQRQSSHDGKELDAGALFVLQSKGSWVHCGYHLTTSIVAPALLSLPYAFKFLGWAGGIMCLITGALVTFYSYNLLSLVLEHHAQLGRRHLRFRDVSQDVLGPRWGKYVIGPVQFAVCYGAVVGACLLGGQCIKAIYLLFDPNGPIKLYEFIIMFGGLMLILAQMPSFHSLRHINMISLLLCLGYSAAATAGSIYIGHTSKGPEKDYSINGDSQDLVFGIFNGVAIIATTFGNGIIPEIQATIAPPVKGKMFKGLCVCYAVVSVTFLSVAISGYWAFGNLAEGQILSNFVVNGSPLLPKWFIFMTNAFVILQIAAVGVIYLQPTNEVLEGVFADPKSAQFSLRNVIPRVISRSLSVAIATTIAAMIPFFGDINGLIGAFGFLPLDFVLPVVLFNLTFKPSKRTFTFWLNLSIAVVFSIFSIIGSVAAVRQIILDAKSYRLFANV
ncbi:GABA transporter 1 isoform X1 [Beta vulgaris subsp. vulgaris]|uniref:GABA transporter 1 isoform X1 n=2 Tax=Beta vulgaris subsp. vulgaris TaxID=3555 RepID=UPI00203720C4|nr:GABA transporter 1 isoform X1 [Beta vulgaris subsp. vulgaris]